ncbi:MAG: HAMP domain-containing sensor histidine kinase, partial [Oscillospiraceae bacterium]|nr:HAMP domain-containing sensor histidine kinase [Oscillospiraceae bacterium]
ISYLFSWLFTRPVSRLSKAARQMAQGDYAVALPPAGRDEIGVLTDDFNRMAVEVARTDRLQKDLVANISHDLRTPLTLMKGYAETIRDLTGEDREKRNEQLGIIIDESDRLSGLVNSVLELSRLEAGTEKPEPVEFDLCDFCEELTYRYTDLCEKHGYTLRLDIPPQERLVWADPALMQRVLHNLLSNAFAHIGPDNEIVLSVRDVPAGVRVTVEDHGKGIAPQDADRVFQRYYRARSDNGKPGAGLGLSIVRAILESHSFAYGVDSTPGQGAQFWFELPCKIQGGKAEDGK